jgi:hypothetical protein
VSTRVTRVKGATEFNLSAPKRPRGPDEVEKNIDREAGALSAENPSQTLGHWDLPVSRETVESDGNVTETRRH